MRAGSFRFRPPPFEPSPELVWVLTRAFGPIPGPEVELDAPDRAASWAAALGLRERIAGRIAGDRETAGLPACIVDSMRQSREALAARTLLLRQLLERVATIARERGASVIALKGIALLESGIADWGARPLLDLDLLVDAERASELACTLESAGLEPSGRAEPHHLSPLADRTLGEVELHLWLPGVAIGAKPPTTAADLRSAGLVRPCERIPGLDLPDRSVLTAHAIAHAIDQHGMSPTAYPITRLVADLIDLAANDHPVPPAVAEWLEPTVSERELHALAELCRALATGQPDVAEGDAAALLRHTLVAVASPDFRKGLRRRAAVRAFRDGRWDKFRSELSRRSQRVPELGS